MMPCLSGHVVEEGKVPLINLKGSPRCSCTWKDQLFKMELVTSETEHEEVPATTMLLRGPLEESGRKTGISR